MQHFQEDDACGIESMCGTAVIAYDTAYSMGHLIAARTCYGGPRSRVFFSVDIHIHHRWFKRIIERLVQRNYLFVHCIVKFTRGQFIFDKRRNVCNVIAKPQWCSEYQMHTS